MEQTQQPDQAIAKNEESPIKDFFAHPTVIDKFREIIGNKAAGFITSVLQIANSDDKLRVCLPKTIFNAAATAATMDLPINKNLGFAWIIGYKGQAQFQMGWKGYVQLAMRTGQYLRLNVIEVYKNQFKSWNELTEELVADFNIPGEGDVVGYCGYFKMINGFEKTVYWTMQKVYKHAKKYSPSFKGEGQSVWKDDFDSMAKKTVLKNMLSKWGILSIEMQKAMVVDQAVIHNVEGTDVSYIDNMDEEVTDKTKGEKAIHETVNMLGGQRKRNGAK